MCGASSSATPPSSLLEARTMTELSAEHFEQRYPQVFRQSPWRRFAPLLVVVGVALYFVYAVWFFSLPTVLAEARWDRLGNYLQQWVSYDVSPEFRLDAAEITPKYARSAALGKDPDPDWVIRNSDGSYTVELGGADQAVTFTKTEATIRRGGETVTVAIGGAAPLPTSAPVPDWVKVKGDEISADMGFVGEVRIANDRVKVRKRTLGWPNFIFDTNSAFWGKSFGEVAWLVTSGPEIEPGRSNLELMFNDIWYNGMWQHGDVWTKLLQTVVMAFAGTLVGAVVAFPIAFLAARNISPNRPLNQSIKRMFDFLRSVDMLIWALFFTRAFGPGPLAGISAIAFTETGTLGKLYAEGLENIDDKQREGLKSTGAAPILVQRYGVVPQVLPVMVSQTLYQWESNTRSASIIGAVGAGGIGLKLWEAMRTNSNWSNVFYMVILILIVVFVFDNLSNALRTRLIGRSQ
jgi:phosphonate transport system permease protein